MHRWHRCNDDIDASTLSLTLVLTLVNVNVNDANLGLLRPRLASMHRCIDVIDVSVNINIDVDVNVNVNVNVSVSVNINASMTSMHQCIVASMLNLGLTRRLCIDA